MGLFTPGKVHTIEVMGYNDPRIEELKNILWDSGMVSDENTPITIVDILKWEKRGENSLLLQYLEPFSIQGGRGGSIGHPLQTKSLRSDNRRIILNLTGTGAPG